MAWESWVYLAPLYENDYTNVQLNNIVRTAQNDIRFSYPDQHELWREDGEIETRYTLDVAYHGALPTIFSHNGKLKHDNAIDHDIEPNVFERLVVSHWDSGVEEFTVIIIISDVEPILDNTTVLGD